MAITCTKKFNWPDGEGGARIFFAGQVIDDQEAAAFAKMTGHGEERGEQEPSRNAPLRSPEDASTDLRRAGGETKAEKKAREKAERAAERAARGAQADEGEADAEEA